MSGHVGQHLDGMISVWRAVPLSRSAASFEVQLRDRAAML